MAIDKSKYTYMSLEDLQTPKAGRICRGASWWIINEKNEVMFYGGSAQCNANEVTAKHLQEKLYPEYRTEFVEMAFLPHRCSDYI